MSTLPSPASIRPPPTLSFPPTLNLHPAFHSSPSSPTAIRSPTAIALRNTGRPLLQSLSPSPPSPPLTSVSSSSPFRASSSPSHLSQQLSAGGKVRLPSHSQQHSRTLSAPASLHWNQAAQPTTVPLYTSLVVICLLILVVLLSTRLR